MNSHTNSSASETPSWVNEAGYQTDRTGFGYHAMSGAALLASLDDKVKDADAKLRDFMAEIESLDPEHDEEPSLPRSNLPGFVSAGHVIPKTDIETDEINVSGTGQAPIYQPTTDWHHLLDENTQHYYYWNMKTNEVTWTIPPDYTEYLLKEKLYKEALAAGKECVSVESEQHPIKSQANRSHTDQPQASDQLESTSSCDIIGPQMPLKNKASSSKERSSSAASQTAVVVHTVASGPPAVVTVAPLTGLVGYGTQSSDDEEDDDLPATKSLVATYNDDEDGMSADSSRLVYEDPQLPPGELPIPEPELLFEGPQLPPNGLPSIQSDHPLEFRTSEKEDGQLENAAESQQAGSSSVLSSVEISEYSNVIRDKLSFLDVTSDNISKLQMLLVQLNTRLDDWLAGGLSKDYLIEKIAETDRLLEICEVESSPAGWRCNWSRKEKQYYYIHEITEEVSWTYPEEGDSKVLELASKSKLRKEPPTGTLAHLSKVIDSNTVDSSLKRLFAKKIVEKCMHQQSAVVNKESLPENKAVKHESNGDNQQKASKHKRRRHRHDSDRSESEHIPKKSKHAHRHHRSRHHSDEEANDNNEKRKKNSSNSSRKHKKHRKHKRKSSSRRSHDQSGDDDAPIISLSSDEESRDDLTHETVSQFQNTQEVAATPSESHEKLTDETSVHIPDECANMELSSPKSDGTTPAKSMEESDQAKEMESIDSLLLSIEKETIAMKHNLPTSSLTPSLPPTAVSLQPLVNQPPLPPLPPASDATKPAQSQTGIAAAPVLYASSESYICQATMLPQAPSAVMDTQPPSEPTVPATLENLRGRTTDSPNNLTKSSKDKSKPKKTSKKASKMPSNLVQKWQKVQTELKQEITREQHLRDQLLK